MKVNHHTPHQTMPQRKKYDNLLIFLIGMAMAIGLVAVWLLFVMDKHFN